MSMPAGGVSGVNRGTLSRVQVQTLRGGQPNPYALIPPNPLPFERAQIKWKALWWFVAIAYTVAALAAVIFVGLTSPTNLPIAMASATYLLTQHVTNLTDYCVEQAQECAELARIEREIPNQLQNLPRSAGELLPASRQGECVVPGLGIRTVHANLAARYLFWRHESETLSASWNNARVNDAPPNCIEAYCAYKLGAQKARVHAAYFSYLIANPNVQEDLGDFVKFVKMPPSQRLMNAGLRHEFPNHYPNDPLLISPDGRHTLSVRLVEEMSDDELRDGIFPIPGLPAPDAPADSSASLP